MKRILTIFFIFLYIILIFKNYNIVLSSTLDAFYIWLNKVFPYLFIMIIIEDLLINLNTSTLFKNIANYIFIMAILSGTPTSTYIITKLYKQGIISKEYANTTLIFTSFANPLFLYTILNTIFINKFITYKLLFIIYISNFILYLYYKKDLPILSKSLNTEDINLSTSIKTSINMTITVLGVITFYLVLSNILINEFNIRYPYNILFKGFIEMTQGLISLINSNILYKEVIALFFITFSGLSINTQVASILSSAKLNYRYFLKGRILQVMIAIFLAIIT